MLILLKASESDGLEFQSTQDQPRQGEQLPEQSQPTLQIDPSTQTHPLHERAVSAAREFRRAEAGLIDALMAVDRWRVFLKLGHASLFKYAVEALHLSEATAYCFITVARKSREVPELQVAVAQGGLSVSKAKKIAAVLTPENQDEWITRAQTLSSRQLEKEVARENPKLATRESAIYVSGKRLKLEMGIEEALMIKVRRAQDQVSRSKNRPVTLEETLEELADFYLKHKDPVERAKRVIAKKGTQAGSSTPQKSDAPKCSKQSTSSSRSPSFLVKTLFTGRVRTPIPAHVAHQVRLRDQGQCQFKVPVSLESGSTSRICASRRWTDLHHILPVSQGGQHTLDNLTTLCKAHHQHTHSATRT